MNKTQCLWLNVLDMQTQVRSKAYRWDVCRASKCETAACDHTDLVDNSHMCSANVQKLNTSNRAILCMLYVWKIAIMKSFLLLLLCQACKLSSNNIFVLKTHNLITSNDFSNMTCRIQTPVNISKCCNMSGFGLLFGMSA